MTSFAPKQILVDLYFDRPFLVSQGEIRDLAHVWMRRELFFIEDKVGAWKQYEEKEMRTEEEYLEILAEKGKD